MKKSIVLFAVSLSIHSSLNSLGVDVTDLEQSRSFFEPRSITHDGTFELALKNHCHFRERPACFECTRINCDVSPFYQASIKSKTLAQYFFPNNKDEITLKEDGTGDVGSAWLRLATDVGQRYSSTVKIRPIRKTYGAYLNVHFDFAGSLEGWWLGITTAAFNARHDVGLAEKRDSDTSALTVFINTALDAFNSLHWHHGKLKSRGLSFFGLDDVQIKLGYASYFCSGGHIGGYLVTTIPTGNTPQSEYFFEPIVGTKNGSFGFGVKGDVGLFETNCHDINFMFDTKFRYRFSAGQKRSFDLTANGDWSRYLLTSSITQTGHEDPGINEFTKEVTVRPGATADLWAAMHCTGPYYHFEVGYNLYWRDHDKVVINEQIDNRLGIFEFAGFFSASTATIDQSVMFVGATNPITVDAAYTVLPVDGLNVETGQQPRAGTHKLYAAFACDSVGEKFVSLGFGASYEIARSAVALEQWAIWGNVQFHF